MSKEALEERGGMRRRIREATIFFFKWRKHIQAQESCCVQEAWPAKTTEGTSLRRAGKDATSSRPPTQCPRHRSGHSASECATSAATPWHGVWLRCILRTQEACGPYVS